MKFNRFFNKREYDIFAEKLKNAIKKLYCEKLDNDICKIIINPDGDRTICFIAGLHGDEPGGPYGVLNFLENDVYVPPTKRLIIIPVANPSGMRLGIRENENGIDINRHFFDELKDECKTIWNCLKNEKIDLLHTLHEDPDLKTFYLYYTDHKELAEDIREMATKYFDIFGGNRRTPHENELYGDKVVEGLIPPPHVKRNTIEDKMFANGIPYITTESPGKCELHKRAKFNENVIKLVTGSY